VPFQHIHTGLAGNGATHSAAGDPSLEHGAHFCFTKPLHFTALG
jgi:hypothetical protein